ncbi:hypothetical protein BJ170DRAFT_588994, partial [Xylariales sp. AK1849]
DVRLNKAVGGYSMPILDMESDVVHDIFDFDVLSIISVTRSFIPLLFKSTRGGMVVNHTSISSVMGLSFQAAYNASKAAAASLTSAMRLEIGSLGIRVVDLKTGLVRSVFYDNVSSPCLPAAST